MEKTGFKKIIGKKLENILGSVNYFNIMKAYYDCFNKFVSDDAKKKKFPIEEWEYPYRIKGKKNSREKRRYYVLRWDNKGIGTFDAAREFMLSAQWYEKKGYIPLLSHTADNKVYKERRLGDDNLWENIFLPYGGRTVKEVLRADDSIVDVGYVGEAKKRINDIEDINISDVGWRDYYKQFYGLFHKYCPMRPDVKEMYEKKKSRLFDGKGKILGVCIREGFGIADEVKQSVYLRINPKEPSMDEVIEKTKQCLQEYECEYIYLSAQFQESIDKFSEEFPGKILYYEREYPSFYQFVEKYKELGDAITGGTIYRSSAEKIYEDYVGTIYCLSKCNSLLGTYSGGTRAALLMNEGNYENVKIFELRTWS